MKKRLVFVVLMLVAAFLTLAPTPTPEPPPTEVPPTEIVLTEPPPTEVPPTEVPPTEVIPPTEIVEVTPTEVIEATPTVPGTLVTPGNPPTPIITLRPPHHDTDDEEEVEVQYVAPQTGDAGDDGSLVWWYVLGAGLVIFLGGLIKLILSLMGR